VDEMLELTLAVGRDSPARARAALGGFNGSLAGLRQSVRILVSALVTNAVQHGGTGPDRAVHLNFEARPDCIRVDVRDHGPGFDRRRGVPVDPVEEGFGLALVDELADRWGVERATGGHVWFEIDRAA
jgi:anti-sigma regulatory factor (Ser/Thr protein kinase)